MNVRLLLQHGWNLVTVGVWACGVSAVVGKYGDLQRYLWYLGLWPLAFDVGYFLAIDVPKYGSLFGEAQTVIVSIAQICAALLVNEHYAVPDPEKSVTLYFPFLFICATTLNHLFGKGHTIKGD